MLAMTAGIGRAEPEPPSPVVFRTVSPCAALAKGERCERLQQLAVPGTDGVELYRRPFVAGSGYTLELVVHVGARTTVAAVTISGGGCATGTCVEDRPRRARLRRLD